MTDPRSRETAILGGGCFWCVEAVVKRLKGVIDVTSGYAGGHVPNPSYEQVCSKTTGHAEVIRVVFDPSILTYRQLLEVFFGAHDPTTPNRQGNDVGPQYRSAIYTTSDAQAETAAAVARDMAGVFDAPIVTEIAPLDVFYAADSSHQDYFDRNRFQPYCAFVISPKVSKLRKQHADLLAPEFA